MVVSAAAVAMEYIAAEAAHRMADKLVAAAAVLASVLGGCGAALVILVAAPEHLAVSAVVPRSCLTSFPEDYRPAFAVMSLLPLTDSILRRIPAVAMFLAHFCTNFVFAEHLGQVTHRPPFGIDGPVLAL